VVRDRSSKWFVRSPVAAGADDVFVNRPLRASDDPSPVNLISTDPELFLSGTRGPAEAAPILIPDQHRDALTCVMKARDRPTSTLAITGRKSLRYTINSHERVGAE
jgi:hypothetical protein